MLKPETTTDECQSCRVCTPCLLSIHSMHRFIDCVNAPRRHECACLVCKRQP